MLIPPLKLDSIFGLRIADCGQSGVPFIRNPQSAIRNLTEVATVARTAFDKSHRAVQAARDAYRTRPVGPPRSRTTVTPGAASKVGGRSRTPCDPRSIARAPPESPAPS